MSSVSKVPKFITVTYKSNADCTKDQRVTLNTKHIVSVKVEKFHDDKHRVRITMTNGEKYISDCVTDELLMLSVY